MNGRYAPSPTGRLHLGNLRTALLAWLFARHSGGQFFLRFEDLDPDAVRAEHYQTQADDLVALGLDWDGPAIRQSDRRDLYDGIIQQLRTDDRVYPCYCSRREIREATQAPNGPWSHGHYPGTCRDLSTSQRQSREESGRPGALRVRAERASFGFTDILCGHHEGHVDDFVIQRGDGTPAYNLVVVIDDHDQGVELVVRADDLLTSTPRQLFVATLLGYPPPAYAHVPLVLNATGDRLAKRDGAVTLGDRDAMGQTPESVLAALAASLGLASLGESVTPATLLDRFDPATLSTEPWTISQAAIESPNLGLDR